MTDLIEANSMGHKPQNIHIYSASWGPTDDGKTVDGPRNATMRAIVKGVNEVIDTRFVFCWGPFTTELNWAEIKFLVEFISVARMHTGTCLNSSSKVK